MQALLLIALSVLCWQPVGSERPDLTGSIRSASGGPVRGATVMIWTAGVKKGYSTYCPSCYADCGKSGETGEDGEFRIEDLDPDLLFRVLVVADGYRPTFVTKVDPAARPVRASMDARPVPPPESKRAVRGVVLDEQGHPVKRAVVQPTMVWFSGGGGRGGAVEGLDPIAVTNDQGEFVLCYKDDCAAMEVEVEARGFAKTQAGKLDSGAQSHTVTIREGATISGRVVMDGKPLPGVLVGAAQPNRLGGWYLGEHTIGTDDQGRFTFENIPIAKPGGGSQYIPNSRIWNVYAKMDSVRDKGASTCVPVLVESHGAMYEAPDVEVRPGLSLSGRVVLSDAQPIPEGMRIFASPEHAWDTQIVPIAADGSFSFRNLPPGTYSVYPAVKGYFVSPRNPCSNSGIRGELTQSMEDFVILLEPGEGPHESVDPRKYVGKPLRPIDSAKLNPLP